MHRSLPTMNEDNNNNNGGGTLGWLPQKRGKLYTEFSTGTLKQQQKKKKTFQTINSANNRTQQTILHHVSICIWYPIELGMKSKSQLKFTAMNQSLDSSSFFNHPRAIISLKNDSLSIKNPETIIGTERMSFCNILYSKGEEKVNKYCLLCLYHTAISCSE